VGRIAARRIALQVLALVLFGTAATAEIPKKGISSYRSDCTTL
jgi:hypothetical protein